MREEVDLGIIYRKALEYDKLLNEYNVLKQENEVLRQPQDEHIRNYFIEILTSISYMVTSMRNTGVFDYLDEDALSEIMYQLDKILGR